MNDYLTAAIMAAGEELGRVHQWQLDDGESTPSEDGTFLQVLRKHLEPLLDPSHKQRRIAVLRAELKILEAKP